MTDALTIDEPAALLAREAALRADGPARRMRDAAAALGVPEAALLEARRSTGAARRLDPRDGFAPLLSRLGSAGEVMALTRNEACVHETRGPYGAPEIFGAMGQIVGEIDLRLFLSHWRIGYALCEETRSGPRTSLQFFDASGTAIHKVHATPATDTAAFETLIRDFTDTAAEPARFEEPAGPAAEQPDAAIDAEGLRAAWDALEHSHAFHGLLRRFGAGRVQALRLGGPARARPVGTGSAGETLRRAAAEALPLMIFTGNPGCVQIHSGPVCRIETMGPWLNVLDPRFNLHLREDRIASAWVVRKPSRRGDIHSLELFDAAGEIICQIFGERPPGGTERADWRALATGLPDAASC
ncbi:ChuX/HutX family heme-like substrate-binding protein [Rhodobacteraceae bacterium DSL-40]|uniref:hemin-degrading factor n=1 Tax=Amaricoccus sp. B4 TaxID=3368557 RepID=UPI000DAC44A1